MIIILTYLHPNLTYPNTNITVFKCLRTGQPAYLSRLFSPALDTITRSSMALYEPSGSGLVAWSSKTLAFRASRSYNSLPARIRSSVSISVPIQKGAT